MHLRYLAQHRLEVGIVCRESRDWQCRENGSSKCAVDELSTIQCVIAQVSQCVPHCPNKNDYPWLASDSILERTICPLSKVIISVAPQRPVLHKNLNRGFRRHATLLRSVQRRPPLFFNVTD